jgi:beta-catenin-like protein 1
MQPLKKQKSTTQTPAPEDTTHTLGILSSLFTNLPSDSPVRIRLLAKFVENNYEKTDKLLDIRTSAQARLTVVDREIDAEKKALLEAAEEVGDEEDAWYLRRLEGGLYTLQTVDYILAWIVMEDDGVCTIRFAVMRAPHYAPGPRPCTADAPSAQQVLSGRRFDPSDLP